MSALGQLQPIVSLAAQRLLSANSGRWACNSNRDQSIEVCKVSDPAMMEDFDPELLKIPVQKR